MDEFWGLYAPGKSPPPSWSPLLGDLSELLLDKFLDWDIGSRPLETWGDEFILGAFRTIAEQVAALHEPPEGNLAFTAMCFKLILQAYLETSHVPFRKETERAISELKEYLWAQWHTDLDRGEVAAQLQTMHEPLAKEVSMRWRNQLQTLTEQSAS